jgi:hypothetical protein
LLAKPQPMDGGKTPMMVPPSKNPRIRDYGMMERLR